MPKNTKRKGVSKRKGGKSSQTVRISGREFIGSLDQAVSSSSMAFIGQNVEVNDANFSARLNNLSKNFIKWRLTKLKLTQLSSQSQVIAGGFQALSYEENPDAATPTTLDQMVSGNGQAGGSQDHIRVSGGSSEWLNCRVGVVNTDIEFYVAGAIYCGAQSDGTKFMNTICLAEYTVEFKDPV